MQTAPTSNDYAASAAAESKKWEEHLRVEASGEWHAWLDHPMINEHYRQRARVEGQDWARWVTKRLDRPAENSLDLGCGAGTRSLFYFREGLIKRVEGFDISEARIAEAERVRMQNGIPGAFEKLDCNTVELTPGQYDLIFSAHSFHHFIELEHIMQQVSKALAPDGLFVLEEFTGPTQFQWSDEQIDIVKSLLTLIPERLRQFRWNASKVFEGRPTPAEVVAVSPFELIRSAEIVRLFKRHFHLVTLKSLGGTIQQLLYNGIIHNFDPADPVVPSTLQAIWTVEDALIDNGLLPSDFTLLIGQRQDAPLFGRED